MKNRLFTDVYRVGRIIAVLNLLAALGLIGLYIGFARFVPAEQIGDLVTYIPALIYLLVTLLLIAGNVYCACRLWKSNKNNVRKLTLVSLVPLFVTMWPLIFLTASFTTEFMLLFLLLIFALFFLILLWHQFKKLSVIIFLITFFIGGYMFFYTFEENYCWGAFDRAKDKDVMYYDLTEAEKSFMEPGASITGGWRVYLACRDTFNFVEAIKETYIMNKR